jgi:2'-hydroxyisoflavone reductase
MAPSRRDFLSSSLGVAGAMALPSSLGAQGETSAGATAAEARKDAMTLLSSPKPLRILFLGGTGFIGPHMVRYAMYRGHTVTLFNRGRTDPGLFPGVDTLVGDRDGDLESLKGKEWDAVIDNSGYVPRHVRDSADLLKDSVGQYLFTSTASVYQFDQPELPEDADLLPIDDPTSEDTNRYYGPLKVLCEDAVREMYGSRGTVVRLHVVAGPGDPTDRFTYWPVRIDAGGEVIAPGDMDNPVQYIDVRDLAEFNMHLLENQTPGTFNAAGPTLGETGMAEFLYGIRAITTSAVSFRWVDEATLRENQIRPPLWFSQNGPARGACRVRVHRGVAAGLKFRPLAETARDTLEWFYAQPAERRQALDLNLDRDAQLLASLR